MTNPIHTYRPDSSNHTPYTLENGTTVFIKIPEREKFWYTRRVTTSVEHKDSITKISQTMSFLEIQLMKAKEEFQQLQNENAILRYHGSALERENLALRLECAKIYAERLKERELYPWGN